RGSGVAEERYQKNRAKCKERSSLPRCPARLFESRISEKKPSGPELISCDDRDAVRVHNPSSDIGADARTESVPAPAYIVPGNCPSRTLNGLPARVPGIARIWFASRSPRTPAYGGRVHDGLFSVQIMKMPILFRNRN